MESQSSSIKIRTETEILPYWNMTNFSLWRSEEFSIVGVIGAVEMCLHNSVMLWRICRGFSQWFTEYPNYYSQWSFTPIFDFCWVSVCSGSNSRADVSAPWLKLLPSCLSFATFIWFKMLHFFYENLWRTTPSLSSHPGKWWLKRNHTSVSEILMDI